MAGIVFFNEKNVSVKDVGGKGFSLIRLYGASLNVPKGFVLSVDFFGSWLEKMKEHPSWKNIPNLQGEALQAECDKAKEFALSLQFSDSESRQIKEALSLLNSSFFAVRSSSPQEDDFGASFAGGYETSLGVAKHDIEAAIRKSFASAFDSRIVEYKRQKGYDPTDVRIAVVVQEMVNSESSGVAFSINPVINSYDECVINANFGLGESVVSGKVTPDSFVVEKYARKILDKKLGGKDSAIFASDSGGVSQRQIESGEFCISDLQALEIADLARNIEDFYGIPMDIEWAYAGGKLHVLQARPVTALFPLAKELQTKPGENKILYVNGSLVKQGILTPVSVMCMDMMNHFQSNFYKMSFGQVLSDVKKGLYANIAGMMLVNISNMSVLFSKKRFESMYDMTDIATSRIIASIDMKEYENHEFRKQNMAMIRRIALQNIGTLGRIVSAFMNPQKYRAFFLDKIKDVEEILEKPPKFEDSFANYLNKTSVPVLQLISYVSMPMTWCAEIARALIKRILLAEPEEFSRLAPFLERSLPDNITIEMGLSMYDLAQMAGFKKIVSQKDFVERFRNHTFEPEFQNKLDVFVARFGARGPKELDIASQRLYETPDQLYSQLQTMTSTDEESNPRVVFEKARAQREESYHKILAHLGKKSFLKRWLFRKSYNALTILGGFREIHKYYLIRIQDVIRKAVMNVGETFVGEGRLDLPNQVFDLYFKDIDLAIADKGIDLRAIAHKNTEYMRLYKNVIEMPRIFDSRGRIFRLVRKSNSANEIIAEPISPGVVRGKVKILRHPKEKPLYPGEILVAQATDPGWTPLFVNAAGIILGVGGVLQHGSLVAREYGKPCVAGIDDLFSKFRDGMEVELDGSSGIIKIL